MAKPRRSKTHTAKSRRKQTADQTARPGADRVTAALAAVGMLITGYLTVVAWSSSPVAFCQAGSGCDIIQQSHWSTVLGLPVALWGFGVYALLGITAALMKPRLRRWRRLWTVALVGLAISLYLTLAGIIALDAVCIWCLASLVTISAIFAWLSIQRPESAPGMAWSTWATRNGALVVVVLVLLHVYYSGLFQPGENPRLKALATHLDDYGAKYYGAYWCPNCQEQEALFGASKDRLPYVECTPDGRNGAVAFVCISKGIEGYPTWIIDGRHYRGIQQPEQLARYTGFDWQGFDSGGGAGDN